MLAKHSRHPYGPLLVGPYRSASNSQFLLILADDNPDAMVSQAGDSARPQTRVHGDGHTAGGLPAVGFQPTAVRPLGAVLHMINYRVSAWNDSVRPQPLPESPQPPIRAHPTEYDARSAPRILLCY